MSKKANKGKGGMAHDLIASYKNNDKVTQEMAHAAIMALTHLVYLDFIKQLIKSYTSMIFPNGKGSADAIYFMETIMLVYDAYAENANPIDIVFKLSKRMLCHSSNLSVDFLVWVESYHEHLTHIKKKNEPKIDWIRLTGGKLPTLPLCKVKLSFDSKDFMEEIHGNEVTCVAIGPGFSCQTDYLNNEVAHALIAEYGGNYKFTHFAISYDI